MKNTRRKWIIGFLIAAVCLLVFGSVQLFMHLYVSVGDELDAESLRKSESIINTYRIATENDFHRLYNRDKRIMLFRSDQLIYQSFSYQFVIRKKV